MLKGKPHVFIKLLDTKVRLKKKKECSAVSVSTKIKIIGLN